MTFDEATKFLYSFLDWEKKGGRPTNPGDLAGFKRFLGCLGNPQDSFRKILIVGTNGKGSVGAMLAGLLSACGESVGLYTSPHLISVRERIQVRGCPISENDFADGLSVLKNALPGSGLARGGYRTTFELLTALALLHFQKAAVDVAIVEAGLGGRLDSTSVLNPDLSIITPIHMDHTATLGRRLKEIASDKAGAIRGGRLLVSAPQMRVVGEVLANTVAEINPAEWIKVGRSLTYRSKSVLDGYRSAVFRKGGWVAGVERLPLRGKHQVVNAATAIAAALLLHPKLDQAIIERGFDATRWPGRLEVVDGAPTILLEGAHNPHAARALAGVDGRSNWHRWCKPQSARCFRILGEEPRNSRPGVDSVTIHMYTLPVKQKEKRKAPEGDRPRIFSKLGVLEFCHSVRIG